MQRISGLLGLSPNELTTLQRERNQQERQARIEQLSSGYGTSGQQAMARLGAQAGTALRAATLRGQEDPDIMQARQIQDATKALSEDPEFKKLNPFEQREALLRTTAQAAARLGDTQLASQALEGLTGVMAQRAQYNSLVEPKAPELPADVRKFNYFLNLANNPEASESTRAAARAQIDSIPANVQFFEYLTGVLEDPNASAVQKAAAKSKLSSGGITFETKPDGSVRLVTGGGGELTTGARTSIQQLESSLERANGVLSALGQKIQDAPETAFGLIGDLTEKGAAYAEQFSFVPGVSLARDFLTNKDRTELRTYASQMDGFILPILTGDTRFTDADVNRARNALRILEGASSKTQATIAYNNLNSIMDRVRSVTQEQLGSTQAAETANVANDAADEELTELEAQAKAMGIDVESLRKEFGVK
jgi:hypothetical protein